MEVELTYISVLLVLGIVFLSAVVRFFVVIQRCKMRIKHIDDFIEGLYSCNGLSTPRAFLDQRTRCVESYNKHCNSILAKLFRCKPISQ